MEINNLCLFDDLVSYDLFYIFIVPHLQAMNLDTKDIEIDIDY